MAQRFDTRRFELVGDAVPIAENVPNLSYRASGANVLVYVQGRVAGERRQLTWHARDGKVLGMEGQPGIYGSLALSPDDKRVVFERGDPQNSDTKNLWLYEFGQGVATPLTSGKVSNVSPVWAPDGSRIAYFSFRNGHYDIFQIASNFSGGENLLLESENGVTPSDWSADGLLFFNSRRQLSLLPLNSGNADPKLIPLESSGRQGRFSPDGHWIAYSSNVSGRNEIYLRPFELSSATKASDAKGTPVTGKTPVSKDGGTNPRWRGKELFYRGSDASVMAVDVSTSELVGITQTLSKVPAGAPWDVSSDGKRFLVAVPLEAQTATQRKYTVVLNWQASLKK